jgi:hypothetical protein
MTEPSCKYRAIELANTGDAICEEAIRNSKPNSFAAQHNILNGIQRIERANSLMSDLPVPDNKIALYIEQLLTYWYARYQLEQGRSRSAAARSTVLARKLQDKRNIMRGMLSSLGLLWLTRLYQRPQFISAAQYVGMRQ